MLTKAPRSHRNGNNDPDDFVFFSILIFVFSVSYILNSLFSIGFLRFRYRIQLEGGSVFGPTARLDGGPPALQGVVQFQASLRDGRRHHEGLLVGAPAAAAARQFPGPDRWATDPTLVRCFWTGFLHTDGALACECGRDMRDLMHDAAMLEIKEEGRTSRFEPFATEWPSQKRILFQTGFWLSVLISPTGVSF